MIAWHKSDVGPFDPERTDKAKILEDKIWVPCRICRDMFAKIRLTVRFCSSCERAFCEGEHGSFTGRNIGICVRCYNKTTMEMRATKSD